MENQEETSVNKVVRNDKGQVISGTPNPNGRPKGAGISITTEIKRELLNIPAGKKSTYLALLIKRILVKGIIDGDLPTIKQIWNYVDGMPKQTIENLTNESIEQTLDIIKNGIKESNKAIQDRQQTSGTDTDPNADIRDDSDKKSQEGDNDSSDTVR